MQLVCTGVLILLALRLASGQSCEKADADVLILGAGASGIAAAKTLYDGGITDFIILEASDRIGGRMRAVDFAGVKVEKGANWIQGLNRSHPESHPLWPLVQTCGLDGVFTTFDGKHVHVYDNAGANITNSSLLRWDDWDKAYDNAEITSIIRSILGQRDISAREGLIEGGWVPTTAEDNFTEWWFWDFCETEPPDNVSLLYSIPESSFIDPGFGEAQYFVTDQRGYAWLMECVAEEFGDKRLHLNATVSVVEWSDDCVCVTVKEGDQRYCASYAIVTFSIGVLKSDDVQFIPDLPSWKSDIINAFDLLNYLKIFVEFNETFWDKVQYIGYADKQRGYYPLFQPMEQFLPGNPNVILATLTGALADHVVNQPIEVTTLELTQVLRTIYGEGIPDPVDILVCDWRNDPLFLGTYSNVPIGVSDYARQMIANPNGRLYFCGEATSRYIGFVHGAYLSGIDTANTILDAEKVNIAHVPCCSRTLIVMFVGIVLQFVHNC